MSLFTAEERQQMLSIANRSIDHGLEHGTWLKVKLADYNTNLQHVRASFVTIEIDDKLRGCIGTLEAMHPLVYDVAHNSFNAAFRDPRFKPITAEERQQIQLHISVLSDPENFPVEDEQDLLNKLHPNVDGLILIDGTHHATFLPAVWESLPDPKDFVSHLKQKAGLASDYWSESIHFKRYITEVVD